MDMNTSNWSQGEGFGLCDNMLGILLAMAGNYLFKNTTWRGDMVVGLGINLYLHTMVFGVNDFERTYWWH